MFTPNAAVVTLILGIAKRVHQEPATAFEGYIPFF